MFDGDSGHWACFLMFVDDDDDSAYPKLVCDIWQTKYAGKILSVQDFKKWVKTFFVLDVKLICLVSLSTYCVSFDCLCDR